MAMSFISAQQVLNWGPITLFALAIIQSFGAIALVSRSEGRPVFLYLGKTVMFLGYTFGAILFGLTLQAGDNLLIYALRESGGNYHVLVLSIPVISYLFPSLMAPFCFKGLFPRQWKKYVVISTRKQRWWHLNSS